MAKTVKPKETYTIGKKFHFDSIEDLNEQSNNNVDIKKLANKQHNTDQPDLDHINNVGRIRGWQ